MSKWAGTHRKKMPLRHPLQLRTHTRRELPGVMVVEFRPMELPPQRLALQLGEAELEVEHGAELRTEGRLLRGVMALPPMVVPGSEACLRACLGTVVYVETPVLFSLLMFCLSTASHHTGRSSILEIGVLVSPSRGDGIRSFEVKQRNGVHCLESLLN